MNLTLVIIIVLTLLAIPFFIKYVAKHRSLYPFMPLKYNFGKRRVTFAKVLQLLEENNAKIMVETGTSRKGLKGCKKDGAATIIFGKWAQKNGAVVHSVDISEDSVAGSQKEVNNQGLSDVVTVHLNDSLKFLKEFDQKIDFLYLDSYDYSKKDKEIQVKSQEHHLKEFQIIESKLSDKSIVLIDDCKLPGGGKGKSVVEYMKKNGWKVLLNKYQILLVKN